MADQIGREAAPQVVLILRPAIFDRDVAAFDIAAFAQAPPERGDRMRQPSGGTAAEDADDRPCELLGMPCDRPRSRAADERHDLAPIQPMLHASPASLGTMAGYRFRGLEPRAA